MELSFDKKVQLPGRLAFVRQYAVWVKRTPDAELSRQQAALIDRFTENTEHTAFHGSMLPGSLMAGNGMSDTTDF